MTVNGDSFIFAKILLKKKADAPPEKQQASGLNTEVLGRQKVLSSHLVSSRSMLLLSEGSWELATLQIKMRFTQSYICYKNINTLHVCWTYTNIG